MKTCTRCKQVKPLSEFQKLARSKDGRNTQCRECKRAYDNAHYAAHPERRKSIGESRTRGLDIRRKFIYDYLLEHPCEVCGESDPIVLQFDHLDPSEKLGTISRMVSGNHQALIEEMNKCRVLCGNCHARHTAIQFGWYARIL